MTGWVLATGRTLNLELHATESDRQTAVEKLSKDFEDRGLPPLDWKSKYRESTRPSDPSAQSKDIFAQKAWLGVPILSKDGKVVGVLRMSERRKGNFTEEEVGIVESCVHQIELAISREQTRREGEQFLFQVVAALAATIDAKDSYTERHSQKVRIRSKAIGQKLGFDERRLGALEISALLHDIGKIGVPDGILSKAGTLNFAEKKAMEMHPEIGYDILKNVTGYDMEEIKLGVRHHHERVDGKGYPDKLKDKAISEFAKIIAVADTFDAITTNRPYRSALSFQTACAELVKGVGTQFDKRIVNAFMGVMAPLLGDPTLIAGARDSGTKKVTRRANVKNKKKRIV